MATVKPDAVLTPAVEVARAAAAEIAEPGTVGEHLGAAPSADLYVELAESLAPSS
mgnify:CR=1 FL=1